MKFKVEKRGNPEANTLRKHKEMSTLPIATIKKGIRKKMLEMYCEKYSKSST